jgi:F-type H+-transporting ATPase subunit a
VPKRRILGCSYPILIGIAIIILALTIVGLVSGALFSSFSSNAGLSWLKVPSPAPEIPPGVVTEIGGFPITNTMITAWISIIVILLVSILAFRKPKLIPRGLQLFMEYVYGSLLGFCVGVAGEKNGRRFFPVMATIFIFVITNAWLSLIPIYGDAMHISAEGTTIPLLRGANTDLNVTLALALFSFFSIEYYGFKDLGFLRYISKFIRFSGLKKGLGQLFSGKAKTALGTIAFGALDVVVGAIEALSEVIRILSFTFRLFGNMIAGEIVLLIAAFLVPMILAIPFYGLEFFVGFIQAFIFGGLTLVFISIAVTHEEAH